MAFAFPPFSLTGHSFSMCPIVIKSSDSTFLNVGSHELENRYSFFLFYFFYFFDLCVLEVLLIDYARWARIGIF